VAWTPVVVSIVAIGMTLLVLALRVAAPRVPAPARLAVRRSTGHFAATALLVDDSYRTIVRFYAPVVVLFLMVAVHQALRTAAAAGH
jgi:hypothetical protein